MSTTKDISAAQRYLTINATPNQVFEALTTPAKLRQWFCDDIETDMTVGGPFRFWGRQFREGTERSQASQTLLELESPKKVSIGWPFRGLDTVLTVEIDPNPTGSTVVATHRLPDNQDVMNYWFGVSTLKILLYNLRNYVETGRAILDYDLRNPGTDMTCSVTIDAPKEDVWAALTIPEKMDVWVGTGATVDLREGGEYQYGWGHGPYKILELQEGERLVTDWRTEGEPVTTAEWTISGEGGTTTLTITHSGFDNSAQTVNYIQGWSAFLGAVKAFVEGRDQAEETGHA